MASLLTEDWEINAIMLHAFKIGRDAAFAVCGQPGGWDAEKFWQKASELAAADPEMVDAEKMAVPLEEFAGSLSLRRAFSGAPAG